MARASEREKQLEFALQNERSKTEFVQQIIAVGLDALGPRILTAIALLGDFVFFLWVMAAPTWERLAAAVLFGILSWCVVNYKPQYKETTDETQT